LLKADILKRAPDSEISKCYPKTHHIIYTAWTEIEIRLERRQATELLGSVWYAGLSVSEDLARLPVVKTL
jgi:bifunctional DNase/RNase